MRESAIERYLIDRVYEAKGEVRKVKWISRNGAPDRLVGFTTCQKHAFVELKAPKKGLDAHQRREHARLKSIGFEVWVLNTKKKVDAFMQHYGFE